MSTPEAPAPETSSEAAKPAPQPAPGRVGRSAWAAFGNLFTKVVIYPLSFGATVVVDRALGSHDRGVFAFLLLVGNFIMPLFTFGLGGAAIYAVSAKKFSSSDVAFTTVLTGVVQGLITSIVTYALWRIGGLGKTGSETPWSLLWPILAIAPLQGVQLMASRVLFGESRFGISNWLNIGRAFFNPVLLLLFVIVLPWELEGAVIATVVVNVLSCVATLAALVPSKPKLRYDHAYFVFAIRYGLKMWIGDLTTRANLRLDQMLLGVFAPAAALGNYSVAVRLSEFLWIGIDSVSPVLFNRLAAAEKDRRVALTGLVHRVGFWSMVPISVAAGVVCYWAIPFLWGPDFREAAILIQLMLPGTVALFTAKILTKYFAAVGKPELAGRLGILSGVTGTALYFVLVPLGATYGAAVASSLSYAFMSAFAILIYRREIAPAPMQLFGLGRDDVEWASAQVGGKLLQRLRRRAAR